MQKLNRPHLSIVVPFFNEEESLPIFLKEIGEELRKFHFEHELVLVNDGSTDGSLEVCGRSDLPNLKIVNLVSNSGHMAAILAGLNCAEGEIIITMDADLQHPPKYIRNFIEEHERSKVDVVYGVQIRTSSDGRLRNFFSKLFYLVIGLGNKSQFLPNAAEFRLMSRFTIDRILELPQKNLILRFVLPEMKFSASQISFKAAQRIRGRSKYSTLKLISFALDSIFFHSSLPLKFVFILTSFFSISSILSLFFTVFSYFYFTTVAGWASLLTAIFLLFAILFLSLSIIAKALQVLTAEVKDRPSYLIRDIFTKN